MKLVRIAKNHSRKDWGCPLTRNRSNWCFRLCTPKAGRGRCGRLAPHGFLSRIQQAILDHKLASQIGTP
jgi:hypothetical protein